MNRLNQFLETPLQDCALGDIPGITQTLAKELEGDSINTAEKLMGQFLMTGKDPEKMARNISIRYEMRPDYVIPICEALVAKGYKINRQEHALQAPCTNPRDSRSVFLATPIHDCDIRCIPEMNRTLQNQLMDQDIDTAEKLIGFVLLKGRNPMQIATVLQDKYRLTRHESSALSEILCEKALTYIQY